MDQLVLKGSPRRSWAIAGTLLSIDDEMMALLVDEVALCLLCRKCPNIDFDLVDY